MRTSEPRMAHRGKNAIEFVKSARYEANTSIVKERHFAEGGLPGFRRLRVKVFFIALLLRTNRLMMGAC